jgi:hypothetical protein
MVGKKTCAYMRVAFAGMHDDGGVCVCVCVCVDCVCTDILSFDVKIAFNRADKLCTAAIVMVILCVCKTLYRAVCPRLLGGGKTPKKKN